MYKCHGHGIQVMEKVERFRCIYSIWGSDVDASGCTDEQ